MEIEVDRDRAVEVLGVLRELRRQKYYPFDRSVLPQTLTPASIQNNRPLHSSFLFYACHYMRGGIESEQVFRALFVIHAKYPWMFEPGVVAEKSHEEIKAVLKNHIGWDAETASKYWWLNSQLLVKHWGGEVLNVIRGLHSYEEGKRRIRNKRSEELYSLDSTEFGFYGFQEKMVSMIIYFWDWAGLLEKKFLYAPPVDFHHCRLMLGLEIVKVSNLNRGGLRYVEKLQEPIRNLLLWYCRRYKADPKEIADVLWLHSKDLCGISPVTTTWEDKENPFEFDIATRAQILKGQKKKIIQTCGVCAVRHFCNYAIPAGPYYGRTQEEQGKRGRVVDGGKIILLPRSKNFDNIAPKDFRFRRPSPIDVQEGLWKEID
jgi:hypothetical protein